MDLTKAANEIIDIVFNSSYNSKIRTSQVEAYLKKLVEAATAQ